MDGEMEQVIITRPGLEVSLGDRTVCDHLLGVGIECGNGRYLLLRLGNTWIRDGQQPPSCKGVQLFQLQEDRGARGISELKAFSKVTVVSGILEDLKRDAVESLVGDDDQMSGRDPLPRWLNEKQEQ